MGLSCAAPPPALAPVPAPPVGCAVAGRVIAGTAAGCGVVVVVVVAVAGAAVVPGLASAGGLDGVPALLDGVGVAVAVGPLLSGCCCCVPGLARGGGFSFSGSLSCCCCCCCVASLASTGGNGFATWVDCWAFRGGATGLWGEAEPAGDLLLSSAIHTPSNKYKL